MSGDAFSKVKAGERLKIPAAAWNACLDAAADFRRRQMSRGAGEAGPGSLPGILVRNDTGGDLEQFSVVALSGLVIAESDSHEQFAEGPVFKAVAPTAGCFVAILQEPIRQDGIGRALVSGVTPVQVAVTSGHTRAGATTATTKLTSGVTGRCEIVYAEGASGDQWCIVRLNQRDEAVALDSVNTPNYLAALFNDTGTKGEDDALVKLDALQGTAPGQKVRLYVDKQNRPEDWDEKVAVDGSNTPDYLAALFNDTGSRSGNDVLVYRDDPQGAAPNQRIRLYVKLAGIQSVCDTQVDLAPDLRINETSGEYTLDVRMRKVRLTLTDGVLCLAAGDYGDWASLCACPEGGSGS